MTKPGWSIARRLIGDERGLALPLVAVAIPVIFGSTALAVDYGYVLQVQNTLQYKTDAAALAGAQGLIDGTYSSKAKLYSASAAVGGVNTISGITVPAPTITTKCSTTLTNAGVACSGSSSSNMIVVTQTAKVPLFFGSALKFAQMTVSATASAAPGGGNYPNLNVMILVDNTSSMTQTDPNCSGKTKIACAMAGVQSFLGKLSPAVDYVGIEVFPGVTSASAQYDVSNCSSHSVTPVEYGSTGFSGSSPTDTYTIVGLAKCTTGTSGTCYRTSNGATSLNSSSNLVKAVGSSTTTGCMKAVGRRGDLLRRCDQPGAEQPSGVQDFVGRRRRELAKRHDPLERRRRDCELPATPNRSSPRRGEQHAMRRSPRRKAPQPRGPGSIR